MHACDKIACVTLGRITMRQRIKSILLGALADHARVLVALLYGDFWILRQRCTESRHGFRHLLYYSYLKASASWVGLGAKFADIPVLPHGLHGIFISTSASIGLRCTIHQNVTIGSTDRGAPQIGNNVLIGAGAVLVGAISIGDGARIGAGTTVAKDIPAGQTVVAPPARFIPPCSSPA